MASWPDTDLQIPLNLSPLQSLNCGAGDRILVSREGRPGLIGALAYCGMNGFTVESKSNRIVVAFRTPASSAGGRFLCRLRVQPPCQCGSRNYSVLTRSTSCPLSLFNVIGLIILFLVSITFISDVLVVKISYLTT